MKSKKHLLFLLLIVWMAAVTRTYGQTTEVVKLFHDLESMNAGTPETFDKADPVLKRLVQSSRENVAEALPVILNATTNPHLSVRRVATMALYEIATRPDGQELLSAQTATLSALLVDPDIPIRRMTGYTIAGLLVHADASSPLVPVLESYLAREDAVSTIGAGVATLLMKAAPNDAASTNAVVQFMRRKDQTSVSRIDLLNAISSFAKSHNREIGKEVAAYANDPDEETSMRAIGTLQFMGKDVVLDNRRSLSRIAADTRETPNVRNAATEALSTTP